MPDADLAILDSSVYIEIIRTGRFTLDLLRSRWIIRCSVVVLQELRRGARTRDELRFVSELVRQVQIVTPSERQWIESAEIVGSMANRKRYGADRIRSLTFDCLIALSTRGVGATLITANRRDFEAIRAYRPFKVLYWEE